MATTCEPTVLPGTWSSLRLRVSGATAARDFSAAAGLDVFAVVRAILSTRLEAGPPTGGPPAHAFRRVVAIAQEIRFRARIRRIDAVPLETGRMALSSHGEACVRYA